MLPRLRLPVYVALLSALGLVSTDPVHLPSRPVVIVGDSVIAAMSGQMSATLALVRSWINKGVSGYTTAQIASVVAGLDMAYGDIFIEGGINDFLLGSQDEILANYKRMLDSIQPPHKAYVLGIFPLDMTQMKAARPDWLTVMDNEKVTEMNAKITALCADHTNCRTVTAQMTADMAGLTFDGLHWKPSTYKIMGRLWLDSLEAETAQAVVP